MRSAHARFRDTCAFLSLFSAASALIPLATCSLKSSAYGVARALKKESKKIDDIHHNLPRIARVRSLLARSSRIAFHFTALIKRFPLIGENRVLLDEFSSRLSTAYLFTYISSRMERRPFKP